MKKSEGDSVMRFSNEKMRQIFDALKNEYDIFGPVLRKGGGLYPETDICVYARLESWDSLCRGVRTYFSAKELVFPVSEKLFDFTPLEAGCRRQPADAGGVLPLTGLTCDAELSQDVHQAPRKMIVFARSCDIEGFLRLDKIYLENCAFVDPYYKSRREAISFFLLECHEAFDGCFCGSVGGDTTSAYAVSFGAAEDSFSVAVKDPAFCKWFGLDEGEVERKETQRGYHGRQDSLPMPDFRQKELLDHPVWVEYSRRCIGCGRCNTVCPTCSCFSVIDRADEKGVMSRTRTQAGCQIDGFARTAGGHEYRTDKGQRMRYKIFHKFHHFKEKFGVQMCTGCGRCVEACPEFIDVRVSLERLSHGQSVPALSR